MGAVAIVAGGAIVAKRTDSDDDAEGAVCAEWGVFVIAHFVICTLGSADLLEVAIASVHKFAGDSTLDLIQLNESAYGNPDAHGRALNQWAYNNQERQLIPDEDVVVLMDPDVAILSDDWRTQMEKAFAEPNTGVWGAGCREDFGLRVHPSMMAIRGTVFNQLTATFRPFHRPSDTEWLDTAGWYCKCVRDKGWNLVRVERSLGNDWHGSAAWYWQHPLYLKHAWDHEQVVRPMWVHLGGGTHSDVTRLSWLQRLKRRQAIAKRRKFIQAVTKVLATPSGPHAAE